MMEAIFFVCLLLGSIGVSSSSLEGGEGFAPRDVPTCNCIALRIENVQDAAYTSALIEMFTVFQKYNTPVTMGILASEFGSDVTLGSRVRDISRNTSWEVEFASSGYVFINFASMPYADQLSQLNISKRNIETILTLNPIRTFIPPGGPFNDDTLRALTALGFRYISSSFSSDNGPFPLSGLSNKTQYHFPSATNTQNPVENLVDFVWPQLQVEVATRGFAVLSIDPSHFSISNTQADYDALGALDDFLALLKNSTYRVVPVGRMNTEAQNTTVTGAASSSYHTCNCVAFRLDDVQDSFCRPAQIAVIETFREYGIPLDTGIIAFYFDKDQEIRNYMKQALADPCSDIELFNHGLYHEDFSALNYSVAYYRIALAQELIYNRTGIHPVVFCPPFNRFNLDTVTACVDNHISHFSSQTNQDPPPYEYVNIYRYPMGAETDNPYNADYYTGVSHNVTWKQIQNQLALSGYSVVMMHPQEYSQWHGNYTTLVNATMIGELRKLLDLVVAAQSKSQIRAVHISQINRFYDVPMPPVGRSTTGKQCLTPVPTVAPPLTTNYVAPDPANFNAPGVGNSASSILPTLLLITLTIMSSLMY